MCVLINRVDCNRVPALGILRMGKLIRRHQITRAILLYVTCHNDCTTYRKEFLQANANVKRVAPAGEHTC